MQRLSILVMVLVAMLLAARPVAAQGHPVVFEGTVVGEDGQPAGDRLVVVFFNNREVGRGETTCDASACRFEILVSDETGIGDMGPDGLPHVQVGTLTVGQAEPFAAHSGAPPRRPVYAVLALKEDPHALPGPFETGRLGLLPDSSVAVIERQRPAQPTRPATAPGMVGVGISFPWLTVSLLVITCCGSLLALVVVVGLAVFTLRRPAAMG